MGKRGPQPLPTAIKRLHGETRSSRLNDREPRPRPNRPRMPATMGDTAKMVWRRVMRDFGDTGVITALDGDALRVYCEAAARYVYAAEMLEKAGPLIRGARQGELVKNPLNQVVRDNADLMRAYARELGLTPGSRAGLTGKSPGDEDPMEKEFFGGRRSA